MRLTQIIISIILEYFPFDRCYLDSDQVCALCDLFAIV